MSTFTSTIHWQHDPDGIVVLTMDDPDQSVNTMNANYLASMVATIDRLRTELDTITGIIVTSGKKTFFAGGDLNELLAYSPDDPAVIMTHTTRIKKSLRDLETLGRPVVAAINGAALGGGLEVALATHHRIAVAERAVVIGFPEVALGLLPGAGGVARTVRMLGVQRAFSEVLASNARFTADAAAKLGLIDEVVATADELIPAARKWIAEHPDAIQPWDAAGYRIPGGTPADAALAAHLPALPALLRKQLKGAPLPAPRAILAAVVEGAQTDFDMALVIESRYFASIAAGTAAKNLIKSTFFDVQAVNSGASRPEGFPARPISTVAIVGAGMMGAGIAYVTARAGIDVVLKDVSREAAERGKQYSETLVATAIERGRMASDAGERLLARITPTAELADVAGADFVVEAVFESAELKQQVFRDIEDLVLEDAVLGSNTSTLPITSLANGVKRPGQFVGIHFFSPVDKMPLVEIIVGEQTTDETLARAFDYARAIGKTPIVVNDSRGFFTSRVILRFLNEAVAAVGEGIEPASIEQAGLQAGYPAGPLQLLDELTLTLPIRIREEAKAMALASGTSWEEHGSAGVFDRMVDDFDRPGRAAGRGFYEYDENGRRGALWPGLRDAFASGSAKVDFDDLKERFLFAEAIESVRCLDEGVLRSVADANVGSLLGIGYPGWTGGVLQYINSYPGGLPGFVQRSRQLAALYGEHLNPPPSLVQKAARNETYS
ncbi:3-hydroxyacyl-CoA dehydrogenase NAD-binding domain-containing protein [soil metagenome]